MNDKDFWTQAALIYARDFNDATTAMTTASSSVLGCKANPATAAIKCATFADELLAQRNKRFKP